MLVQTKAQTEADTQLSTLLSIPATGPPTIVYCRWPNMLELTYARHRPPAVAGPACGMGKTEAHILLPSPLPTPAATLRGSPDAVGRAC